MSWFARLIGRRTVRCSFCSRSRRSAGPFVEGPCDVFICAACVERHIGLNKASKPAVCAFCGKEREVGIVSSVAPQVMICDVCIKFAADIFGATGQ